MLKILLEQKVRFLVVDIWAGLWRKKAYQFLAVDIWAGLRPDNFLKRSPWETLEANV